MVRPGNGALDLAHVARAAASAAGAGAGPGSGWSLLSVTAQRHRLDSGSRVWYIVGACLTCPPQAEQAFS